MTRIPHKSLRGLHSLARAGWAASGTALLAVLVAMSGGGLTYALTTPDSPTRAVEARAADDETSTAQKAADDARTMFKLLSDAVTSSTGGVSGVLAAVPQIFDSVDTARDGASDLVASLDQTSAASTTLGQLQHQIDTLAPAVDQVDQVVSAAATMRANAEALRSRSAAAMPSQSTTMTAQLDAIIAAADAITTLAPATQLKAALTQLSTAASRGASGLVSARVAAHQLRDGLTKISNARPSALAATSSLSAGITQLGIALKSIDAQLALVQANLHSREPQPVSHASPLHDSGGVGDRLAWALFVAGLGGALTYLAAIAVAHRRVRPTVAAAPAPLADIARELGEAATPAHGFLLPAAADTDPRLSVQFARPVIELDESPASNR